MIPSVIKGFNATIETKVNDSFDFIPCIELEDNLLISEWEMSDEELQEIVRTKKLYLIHVKKSPDLLKGVQPIADITSIISPTRS